MRLLLAIALAIFLIALGVFIPSDVAGADVHDVRIVDFHANPPAADLEMESDMPVTISFFLQVQNKSDHDDNHDEIMGVGVRVANPDPVNCSVVDKDGIPQNLAQTIVFDDVVSLSEASGMSPGPKATIPGGDTRFTFECSVVPDGEAFAVTACVDHEADDPFFLDDDDDFVPDNCRTKILIVTAVL